MPRKRQLKTERYDERFPSTLRELMRAKGVSQKELADYIGVARQSVGCYCDGSSEPGLEKVVKIAEFFQVTTDYLLGANLTETADKGREALQVFTGLSWAALESYYYTRNRIPSTSGILESMLCSESFHEVISKIDSAISYSHYPPDISAKEQMSCEEASSLMAASAVRSFGNIVDEILEAEQ